MLGQPGKGQTKLVCSDVALRQYKELLFGKDPESGHTYFDATAYLAAKEIKASIPGFLAQWKPAILSLCASYGLDNSQTCLVNAQGHYLIEANLVCLFISFAEPGFLAQMCDRALDLLTTGVAVSDLYLCQQALERIPKETLKALAKDDGSDD